jgi:hypothetical protein
LLGDGAAPLNDLTGFGIFPSGSSDAERVHSPVTFEAVVLGSEGRGDDVCREINHPAADRLFGYGSLRQECAIAVYEPDGCFLLWQLEGCVQGTGSEADGQDNPK